MIGFRGDIVPAGANAFGAALAQWGESSVDGLLQAVLLAAGGVNPLAHVFAGIPLSEISNSASALSLANYAPQDGGTIASASYLVEGNEQLPAFNGTAIDDIVALSVSTSLSGQRVFPVGTAVAVAELTELPSGFVEVDFHPQWPSDKEASFTLGGFTFTVSPDQLSDGYEIKSVLSLGLPAQAGDPIMFTGGIILTENPSDNIVYVLTIADTPVSGFTLSDNVGVAQRNTFDAYSEGDSIRCLTYRNGVLIETSAALLVPTTSEVSDFTDADATPITSHTSTDGDPWSVVSGTEPYIYNNRIYGVGSGATFVSQAGRTPEANLSVVADVDKVGTTSGSNAIGPAVYDAANDICYNCRLHHGSQEVQFYKFGAGGTAAIGSFVADACADDSTRDLGIEVDNGTVSFLINGVVQATRDATADGWVSGVPAIRGNGRNTTTGTGVAVDNTTFKVL